MNSLFILLSNNQATLPLPQLIFLLIIGVLMIVSLWKIFEKAGKPGWAAIVPIYNMVVLLQIIKKPVWWIILFFIPVVNFIMILIVNYHLAKSFGKDIGFAIGLILLPVIFIPILAFGNATYQYNNDVQFAFNKIDAIMDDIEDLMNQFEKHVSEFIDKGDTSAIQKYMEVSQKIMQKQIEIQNVVEQLTEEQKSRYSKFEKRLDEINKKLEQ
jgi:hypothetical protein